MLLVKISLIHLNKATKLKEKILWFINKIHFLKVLEIMDWETLDQ